MTLPPFEHVVREHGAVVLRVCRALLRPADADDAWAATFLSALEAYPRLKPDSNVRGWLVTIAHRKSLDELRRASRHATPSDDVPALPVVDADPLGNEPLRQALASLPDKQRIAVVLRYLGDLAYVDVATELGGTEAAARRNVADGVQALRRLLPKDAHHV